jgi:hypothetical protein
MLEIFFSLIISLKVSAWKLSEKVRNFVKPQSYVITVYVGDVFKSFFIAKIDIP